MKIYNKVNKKVEIDGAVFELKPLSAKKAFELGDILKITQEGDIFNFNAYLYAILQNTLVGWSGVEDENGNEIKFPKKVEEAIEILPEAVSKKLANELLADSKVTKAEEKN